MTRSGRGITWFLKAEAARHDGKAIGVAERHWEKIKDGVFVVHEAQGREIR